VSLELLQLAEDVARAAGAQLLKAYAAPAQAVEAKSSPTDLVSAADQAAEELIRTRIAVSRPDDGFLGEEGTDEAGRTGLRWVVDPLDGTTNYLFRIPQWAVSIACEDGDGTVIAAVYDPPRDEMWTALRGGAALRDGEPIHGSQRTDLATSLVATGFGYAADVRRAQAARVAALLPEVRDIRRLGSAALDLAWTAAGRYDVYFERGINHWDVAAGALICSCAGLVVEDLPAAPPEGQGILVATPGLIAPMRERLA
jgi:myo-inositol-1(or 4)-monophosphatase